MACLLLMETWMLCLWVWRIFLLLLPTRTVRWLWRNRDKVKALDPVMSSSSWLACQRTGVTHSLQPSPVNALLSGQDRCGSASQRESIYLDESVPPLFDFMALCQNACCGLLEKATGVLPRRVDFEMKWSAAWWHCEETAFQCHAYVFSQQFSCIRDPSN